MVEVIDQRWIGVDRRKKDRRENTNDRREFIRFITGPTKADRRAMVNRRRVAGEWLPTHIR
ncbi:MAG: hypothetical protein D6B28_00380 [Gammaproteobacteria bacterium]|nr:MAG: hypothetical protein D6B28_00380 [Gammaproteobacteria bacterium]